MQVRIVGVKKSEYTGKDGKPKVGFNYCGLKDYTRYEQEEAAQIDDICKDHDITVGDLISQFLCDLIDNNRSGGSDERMMISGWFHRSF